MPLQFGVNIPVQRRARPCDCLCLLSSKQCQANRSVSLLGFDNQAASATCQAAWLRNTSLESGEPRVHRQNVPNRILNFNNFSRVIPQSLGVLTDLSPTNPGKEDQDGENGRVGTGNG